jgi:hypothetical protein
MKKRPSGSHSNRGYTLYLVLVVLSVAGVLFSISIQNAGRVQVEALRAIKSLQAGLLAESGIERAASFFNGEDGHDLFWETDSLIEEFAGLGRVRLACKRFGAYSRISSRGTRLNVDRIVHGMAGRDVPAVLAPTITLTSHIGGLVLSKGSKIDGTVVLHHGDVKQGNNRTPLPGAQQWTQCRESPALPFDKKPLDDFTRACSLQVTAARSDPAGMPGGLVLTHANDSLLRRSPLVVNGDCTIGAITMHDAAIIATGRLTIGSGAACGRTALYASTICVTGGTSDQSLFFALGSLAIRGGRHASQFFATDTVCISDSARFHGASLLVSRRMVELGDSTLSGGVVIAENCAFSGQIVCMTDSFGNRTKLRQGPAIVLGARSTVNGCIVTDGSIDMRRCALAGHLWADAIVAVEENIAYTNWLFGCTIRKPEKEPAFPLVGELPARINIMRAAG